LVKILTLWKFSANKDHVSTASLYEVNRALQNAKILFCEYSYK